MKKENPENVRRRVANHAARQREMGLARVSVWVPVDKTSEVHELAKKLKQESGL